MSPSHLRGEACTQRPHPMVAATAVVQRALAVGPTPLGGRAWQLHFCITNLQPEIANSHHPLLLKVHFEGHLHENRRLWKMANSSIPSRSWSGVESRNLHSRNSEETKVLPSIGDKTKRHLPAFWRAYQNHFLEKAGGRIWSLAAYYSAVYLINGKFEFSLTCTADKPAL